jgi:uncharacterized phosphosugar-binding protein
MTTSDYDEAVRAHLRAVAEHNADTVARVADLLLACVRADGLVHTAGAGHSLVAVAETFYRAGGLACVRPLFHPSLLPMNGALSSTRAERVSGLAAEVLGSMGSSDVLVVFSTSGVNPYPVELAQLARRAGRSVVAVTSGPSSAVAPRRSDSTLSAEATVILDTLVPPGDSMYPLAAPVAAPVSTVANAYVWDLVLVSLIDLAAKEGVSLPLWRSANVSGGEEANESLMARYTPRVPALG